MRKKPKWIFGVVISTLSIALILMACYSSKISQIKDDTNGNARFICEVNIYNFHETLHKLKDSYNNYISGAVSRSVANERIMMYLDYCLDYMARVDTAGQLSKKDFMNAKELSNYVVIMQYMRETIYDSALEQQKSINGAKIAMQIVEDILSGFVETPQKNYIDILTDNSMQWNNKAQDDYAKFIELFPTFNYAGPIN